MPVRRPEDLETSWLAAAVGAPVAGFASAPVGTGQMSETHRVWLDYRPGDDGPASVILKVAAADPASRAVGVGLGAYEREVRFYRDIAPTLGEGGPLARCHHASIEPATGFFTLLLEDLAPGRVGDQIAGCTPAAARDAVDALVALQAPRFDDAELGAIDWLAAPSPLDQALLDHLLPGFRGRYGDRVAPEHLALCETFVGLIDAWAGDRPRPHALVHGDFRLDNLLFAPGGVAVVDFQTVMWGPALLDLSYLLGGSLRTEDRRVHEDRLVRRYAAGVGMPFAQAWEEYRRLAFHNVVMALAASMLVERTPRGDEMFMAMLARGAQHALDLDALSLVDPSAAPHRLRLAPVDERP